MLKVKCKYFKIADPFHAFYLFVLATHLGTVIAWTSPRNGASRWINLVGIQFQPSELAKGAVVLAVRTDSKCHADENRS